MFVSKLESTRVWICDGVFCLRYTFEFHFLHLFRVMLGCASGAIWVCTLGIFMLFMIVVSSCICSLVLMLYSM